MNKRREYQVHADAHGKRSQQFPPAERLPQNALRQRYEKFTDNRRSTGGENYECHLNADPEPTPDQGSWPKTKPRHMVAPPDNT